MRRSAVLASLALVSGLSACTGSGDSSPAVVPTVTSSQTIPSSDSSSKKKAQAEFPENATVECFEGDRAAVSPDRVRQIVGGKTSCELLGAIRAEVDDRRSKGQTSFMVEALSTKANAVRRFDCKSVNGVTACTGRKPSQVRAWVADVVK